jgi:hypothetical protein
LSCECTNKKARELAEGETNYHMQKTVGNLNWKRCLPGGTHSIELNELVYKEHASMIVMSLKPLHSKLGNKKI